MAKEAKKEVVTINLNDIIPNKFQPREVFDDQSLKELAVSIKEHGVIQPIIVREVNGKYEIIAGERRYKASALAGKTTIPAIVENLDDKESSKVALLENLQRKNLNPIEEAKTYQKILELDEMTQEELAKTMGKSQSAVANKLRLLQLNDDVKKALLSEEISERHARTLLRIEDPVAQTEMLKRVITEKINVRDLEKEIDKIAPKKEIEEVVPAAPATPQPETQAPVEPQNVLNNFINDAPLAPTTQIKNPNEEIGKVKIIDDDNPDGEEKFLDYSKIDDDADEEDNSSHTFLTGTTPDVQDIKDNAVDINQVPATGGSSLDSLLNLPTPTVKEEPKEENFLSPAEAIVKTAETEEEEKPGVEDYFKTPDLAAINLPSEIDTGEKAETKEEVVTIDVAKENIKELVNDLKANGINITMDEMDFPQKYQVIIKINKNE
ncbi:MAG: ParB/RepB/Spo0J family partition protein [Bacilli bacterium]|nr:ParB/RepB/Spo0J family partition protein [Bacilli bacterium]MBQ6538684.1 ParB/RepB/Spo0J family partition protein [Bacilli bacterium]